MELLELEARPVCSNCEFYEAKMECSDCREFFCFQCWDAVHYGGKRSMHKFRTLYDFYDRRVDYGDGEFPSCWPTEIEQDDIHGWKLRLAPLREPSFVEGDWEIYIDPNSNRTFYHNMRTNVTTYITPKGME